jgi:SAM-dependent methyltransferase
MSNRYSGNYPIERRAGEIERLHIQSEAMVPDTIAMLDRFADMRGWNCLDLGCGPGGITDLLSARVGAAGRVTGLDMDSEFLEHARRSAPSNVEFRLGDAYGSDCCPAHLTSCISALSQAQQEIPKGLLPRLSALSDRAVSSPCNLPSESIGRISVMGQSRRFHDVREVSACRVNADSLIRC